MAGAELGDCGGYPWKEDMNRRWTLILKTYLESGLEPVGERPEFGKSLKMKT